MGFKGGVHVFCMNVYLLSICIFQNIFNLVCIHVFEDVSYCLVQLCTCDASRCVYVYFMCSYI